MSTITENKRPLIGIPSSDLSGKGHGVGNTYAEYLRRFGDIRLIMPHEEFVKVDLLFLPGGADLNPNSYGQVPGFMTSGSDVFKQYFFDNRLKNYITNTPIFGVCLGFQMLNVVFGGQLTQHLLAHPSSEERGEEGHKVVLLDRSKNNILPVNSHHHQGVAWGQLAPTLEPLAIYTPVLSKDEKKMATVPFRGAMRDHPFTVVEAFRHKELPIAAVQWHPEEWYDSFSTLLLLELLKENAVVAK